MGVHLPNIVARKRRENASLAICEIPMVPQFHIISTYGSCTILHAAKFNFTFL